MKSSIKHIWVPEFPNEPATEKQLSSAERRLGVKIPAAMKRQLLRHNGGFIVNNDDFEAVDGIMRVQEWELASCNDWFPDENEIAGQDKLVIFACHSESHSCFD